MQEKYFTTLNTINSPEENILGILKFGEFNAVKQKELRDSSKV